MAQTDGIRKIKYQPYKFDPDDAYRFAREIGAKVTARGDELEFYRCPYCHGHEKDKKTFSISLKDGRFQCFRDSCHVRGNMLTLAQDFNFSLGNEVDEYYRPQPKKYRTLPQSTTPIKPKAPAIAYLESRGISEKIAEKYEITTQTGKDNVLVFPFYDQNGVLQFVKYRKTDFIKGRDTAKEWCEKKCKPILFGMKQCDLSSKTLIVTEGQLDSLSVAEAGYGNAVSVPTGVNGYTWVPYCWDWIITNFSEIIIFGDHEKGHITLLDDFRLRFSNMDVKNVRPEDYKDCKDANDILRKYGKEQIKKCIENAVSAPIANVISLADAQATDNSNRPKVLTGIKGLDKFLHGGLPLGGLTVLSGRRGDGKSTFASQIILQAANQGYRCFAYSGEMGAGNFKDWIDRQAAGRRHIFANPNPIYGYMDYSMSDKNRNAITEWYRDRIDYFDIDSSYSGEASISLFDVCKQEIIRNDAKVILIDNLMTAMYLQNVRGSDRYEQQSVFVNELVKLASSFGVLVILIAHKRKNSLSTDENDEISGSGDISNLAMVTLAYDRSSDIDPNDRKIKLMKNRLFGEINTDGWIVHYEPASKRVYSDDDDVDVEFGWNTGSIADKANGKATDSDLELFT